MPFGGEFEVTRPTPLQAENDLLGTTAGDVTMQKVWDLSPVDQQSFDPTEPPGRPAGPPTNTVPPSITPIGTLEVGQQLVCSNGAWTGAPTYTRQWASGGNAIGGATAATYTIQAVDVGNMILCRVTGTNAGGTLAVDTAPVGPATVARPTNNTAPVATAPTGAIVGQTVQTTDGTWTGSPSYTRQWLRGNNNIPTATGATYVLAAADAGQNILCRVTATNAGGAVTADSNALGPITVAWPSPTPPRRPSRRPAGSPSAQRYNRPTEPGPARRPTPSNGCATPP